MAICRQVGQHSVLCCMKAILSPLERPEAPFAKPSEINGVPFYQEGFRGMSDGLHCGFSPSDTD
jgi:hypothetical protein